MSRIYPGLMPADRITLAHLSVSSAMSVPNSIDVIGIGWPPRSVSRFLILGSANPALISPVAVTRVEEIRKAS